MCENSASGSARSPPTQRFVTSFQDTVMNVSTPPKFGMGASPRRIEDGSFVRGKGHYTADYTPEGTLAAFVLRSSAAHARIKVGDLAAARSAPGVHLVWGAADVADMENMPSLAQGPSKSKIPIPPYPVLCGDIVRHVGDAIAFVVADDLESAKSAAEMIEVDYDPLPGIVDTGKALDGNAPLVWPDIGTNLAFVYEAGDKAATDKAFASADKVAELTIVNNRVVTNYMEPRAIVAEYDAGADRYKITVGSQGVHGLRDALCQVMKLDPNSVRVITPDVGGGFGTKGFNYREYPLTAKAAKALGRPVKWVSDRSEHFLADAHGRDHVTTGAFALDANGRVAAMRVTFAANMGSYFNQFGAMIPWFAIVMQTGLYDIQTTHAVCNGVFTNTVPTDAYRGAGRPEAAFLVERLMDEAARVTGLAPSEIRRRNFIKTEQLPYKTSIGNVYDTGEFSAHMDKALQVAEAGSFDKRLDEAKKRGRIRGLGFSTYVEICAFAGSENAKLVLEKDGAVSVHVGTQSNGQGHKTAYAQFVGEPLGLDYDKINVVQGDTDYLETGGGTGGSRSVPLGAPAVASGAEKLATQLKEIAAEELEAGAGDIELVGGVARVVGTDRSISYVDLAARAKDKAKLTAAAEYTSTDQTYPNGTHVCEVEIDPETGHTEIVRYTIVDDFGATVNPQLLEGQVHGGVAQSIGQALHEHTAYDADGQLLSATLTDYALPRAYDLPSFHFETRNVPSKNNPFGIKGAGEAGTIGATPTVMNAVVDALYRAYGIRNVDMPATPPKIWEAIEAAKG
jgi:carbon-monoxide dehydrogenase large subunit